MTTPHLRPRAGALLALVAAGTLSCGRQKGPDDAASAPDAGTPTEAAPVVAPPWVGPYSDEQKALLVAPLDAPVAQRATPVYPDLARFTFLGEAPIQVPDDPVGYADMISKTLDESPLMYVFRTGPDDVSNIHALWGPEPADTPDPWKRVENIGEQPSLVDALPSPELSAKLQAASSAQPAESLPLLKEAAATLGAPPGVQAMLADAALAAGDDATAEQAARAALEIDPRSPHAYRVLAEVAVKRGERDKARDALARALAAYPRYDRAWRVGAVLMSGPIRRPIDVPQPFIEVTRDGAVLVVSCERPLCQGYAACKAAFRFEPVFRGSMLREPYDAPYHVSATEEVVCLQAGLGAHLSAQDQGQAAAPSDPTAEVLSRLAQDTGLSSYAMFEIIGQHRPEWLRIAPEAAYQAVVRYVLTHVLGTPPTRPRPVDSGGPPVTADRAPAPHLSPGAGS